MKQKKAKTRKAKKTSFYDREKEIKRIFLSTEEFESITLLMCHILIDA